MAGELVLLSSALSCTALLQGQQLVACIPAAPLLIPASCLPASPLSTGLDCTALSCLLYCLQNWLYEEGEDETKSVYIAKLAEVQQLGGPVEARAANAAALPAAADSLRRACKVGGFPLMRGGWPHSLPTVRSSVTHPPACPHSHPCPHPLPCRRASWPR